MVNLELSEEQTAVRQLARDFVEREITPHVVAWDRAEEIDRSIVKKLGEVGFLGLTVDEEYGGSGGDHLAYCLVTEELGRGDSSVRGIVSVSLGLVAKTIAAWGSEEQKRRWLPGLTAGELVGCFGLTEPGTGSDAGNLATRARRDGDDYVINGSKMFITNGTWADVVLLFARSTDAPGHRGVTAFLVPADTPGLTRRTVHGKLGLRGQATAELVLEDVRVPASAILGGRRGRASGSPCRPSPRDACRSPPGCVGIAQAALDAAVRYAGEREQFGKTIAHHQLVQELISDIAVDVDAARLLTWRVADLVDRGEPFAVESSKAKLFASEAAVRAANNALQVHGGYGYIDEYPAGKLLRDARVMTLYEGTSQIQKLVIGRALTGVSAF
ncbi:acyl-CoA dehydrogenase family protein [Streptomyces thermocoprophilus]